MNQDAVVEAGESVASPTAPIPDDMHPQDACLNCGALVATPHCQACGQNVHIHRSLGAFWHDLAHGVLHFD